MPEARPGFTERRLHARLSRAPRCHELAVLPTPVERLPWLDRPANEVWIKRDDLSSPVYGGGKVRKLEWALASPPFNGDEPIVTLGALGSHHLLAVALFLDLFDRRLHALIVDQVVTEHARKNLAVMASLGTQFWHVPSRARLPLAALRYYLLAPPERRGVYMEAGGSTPLASFGYVEAGLELAAQIDAGELPRPARIYVTGGTAGTCAGLAIGLALAGVHTQVRVVSAVETLLFNPVMFHLKAQSIFAELRRRGAALSDRSARALLARAGVHVSVDQRQVGPGYAVPTPAGKAAIRRAAEHDIALEPTYTGKCMAALESDLDHGHAPAGPILFWTTHASNDLSNRIVEGWESRLPPSLAQRMAERGLDG